MSLGPQTFPDEVSLSGTEGKLVAVSISVDPRRLESLLDVLARVGFPINPQIFHDAATVYLYSNRSERIETTTLVEFPAYEERLDDVRRALDACGFPGEDMLVTGMLDDIHSAQAPVPAPPAAPYLSRYRVKCRATAAVH